MLESENIEKSFNVDFCSLLEFYLSGTFPNFADHEICRFWCDGIAMPQDDAQLSVQNLRETHQIVTKAWLGKTGQDVYDMNIHIGALSLQRCFEKGDLSDCLPPKSAKDWISISVKERRVELWLK